MAAITQVFGTRTAFGGVSGLNSLASATYVALTALDLHAITTGSKAPLDLIVEFELTPGTVSGTTPQATFFAQISMDNSAFSTGPTSGTSTTDQNNLYLIGVLPLNTNSTLQRKGFSVVQALGFVPYAIKPVILNGSGAALAGSGNTATYTIITGDAT